MHVSILTSRSQVSATMGIIVLSVLCRVSCTRSFKSNPIKSPRTASESERALLIVDCGRISSLYMIGFNIVLLLNQRRRLGRRSIYRPNAPAAPTQVQTEIQTAPAHTPPLPSKSNRPHEHRKYRRAIMHRCWL